MNLTDNQIFPELWEYLTAHLTPERKQRFEFIASMRTRFITLVIEDIYQPQNASAVLRTCECFGIQDVHIIENENEFHVNPDVVLGSANWLTIRKWNENQHNSQDCLQFLKKQGYTIAATSLSDESVSLNEYQLQGKTALVFGKEADGISDEVKQHADVFIKIPMLGFTESFNISVSAAICLAHLSSHLRNSQFQWKLEQEEKNELLLEWISLHFKNSELMIERFLKTRT